MADTCVCGGSRGRPNPDCKRCDFVVEVERLRARVAELERARDAAIRELSAASRRYGVVEGVLIAVRDRLDYLRSLWGDEAITKGVVDAIDGLGAGGHGK